MRLLILGGTTEASTLARALAERQDIEAVLSLAGRTDHPAPSPLPMRVGGFGGADGLAAFLRAGRFDAVVDATHPFAARISVNAAEAAAHLALPLAVYTRPAWQARPGDDWRSVATLGDAALALGHEARAIFLTTGRLGLSAFKVAPQHRYLVRSIDHPAPQDCPPICEVVLARGPFHVRDEEALMRRHGIEVLVSKNSGGRAGEAKLDAARAMKIPIVVVERSPVHSHAETFVALEPVLRWIDHRRSVPSAGSAP